MRTSPSVHAAPAGRHARATARLAAVFGALTLVHPACAQMVGLPVVQTPFGGRAFALALDGGSGGDGLRTIGGALAFRKGGSRITGTVGGGAVQGFAKGRPSFGVRVAYLLPLGAAGTLGAAPFVGFGAVSQGDRDAQLRSTNGRPLLPGTISVIPAGVSVGYRLQVAGRAVALHAAPHAQYWRLGAGGVPNAEAKTTTYFRVGVGADVALTRQIGLTLAVEGGGSSEVTGRGQTATGLAEGPRKTLVGAALSYTPRRARR